MLVAWLIVYFLRIESADIVIIIIDDDDNWDIFVWCFSLSLFYTYNRNKRSPLFMIFFLPIEFFSFYWIYKHWNIQKLNLNKYIHTTHTHKRDYSIAKKIWTNKHFSLFVFCFLYYMFMIWNWKPPQTNSLAYVHTNKKKRPTTTENVAFQFAWGRIPH